VEAAAGCDKRLGKVFSDFFDYPLPIGRHGGTALQRIGKRPLLRVGHIIAGNDAPHDSQNSIKEM
jgi:hypothetical protein